ncbi:MAG: hypothetical protein CMF59_12835 [Leptospiraceae bacterium]|nr:hypothetical protein [Leptospiraceae bacterium]
MKKAYPSGRGFAREKKPDLRRIDGHRRIFLQSEFRPGRPTVTFSCERWQAVFRCPGLDFLDIGLISLGLAMDCFAVAFAASLARKVWTVSQAFRIALFFGFFQGFMPYLGWLGGSAFRTSLAPYDHWIAFSLLSIIAFKLFHEAWQGEEPESDADRTMTWKGLLILSLATSVDALAAGLSFSVLDTDILLPVLCIGAVAFLMTILGVVLGGIVRGRLDRWAAAIGGLILLGIGIRILFDHISRGI